MSASADTASTGFVQPEPEVIAAVDLGSNSFHMIVARFAHGQLTVIDRLREMVRLAAGMDDRGRLTPEAAERAMGCLQRFGQRLRDMHADNVRVVGTNTFRRARRRHRFLAEAEEALGHPIEIISGIEEARLVYLGTAHNLPQESGRRLVVDIGGGSTELIVGEGTAPQWMESLHMGCVGLSEKYFASGKLLPNQFKEARLHAQLELRPVETAFRKRGWDQAVGSSGTVRAAAEIQRGLGFDSGGVTAAGLEGILAAMIKAKSLGALELPGLDPERKPVFPGGLVILLELFNVLGLGSLMVSDGALREGLLYDMVGRMTEEDARLRTVRALEQRYNVDTAQAERVEYVALSLLEQVKERWSLKRALAGQLLSWAARLHEIGLDVAHSKYHVHGAYLLGHADLPGFPWHEQKLLAAVVGAHRRKIHPELLHSVPSAWRKKTARLILLLRLAVLLNRSRSQVSLPDIRLKPKKRSLSVRFPEGWLAQHPLTLADLEQEAQYVKALDYTFDFS